MNFYAAISKNYDDIFPVSQDNIDFVKHYLEQYEQPSILDVGCANGNLLIQLQEGFDEGFGIDLDDDMIGLANRLYQGNKLRFTALNMLDIQKYFQPKRFEVISCFGNTLVHLSKSQIADFLRQAKALLTKDGVLLIQILNYDYIFEKNITQLPNIENETITFSRSYDLISEDKIIFRASLVNHESKEQVENELSLFPIRKQALSELLNEAGFPELVFYKDFKGNAFSGEHLPLIVQAKS